MEMTAYQNQALLKNVEIPIAEAVSDFSLTLSEYVEREETATIKHEFHNGKLIEMPGGTLRHARIGLNFGTFLNICLFKKTEDFAAHSSDAHIYIPDLNKSLYPDISVFKDEPIFFQHYKTLAINPLLIIEVLSDGTESYDKDKKFKFYQNIPSFKEYVLVDQYEPKVEIYYCKNGNRNVWQYSFVTGLDASVKLQSVGCTLRLKDIYKKIIF